MRKSALLLIVAACACCGTSSCPDSDFDGVPDSRDACLLTPLCADVDATGCPSDSDGDGVYDGCDECEQSVAGETVDAVGCAVDPNAAVTPCDGPDPRAKSLEFTLISRTDSTSGTILIKGVVDNVGLEDYVSGAGQQDVEIWADNVMLISEPFVNLAVGAETTAEIQITWSTQLEIPLAEFYKLLVTYDPDIFDDGVDTNDDCDLTNNLIIRRASDINTLFD